MSVFLPVWWCLEDASGLSLLDAPVALVTELVVPADPHWVGRSSPRVMRDRSKAQWFNRQVWCRVSQHCFRLARTLGEGGGNRSYPGEGVAPTGASPCYLSHASRPWLASPALPPRGAVLSLCVETVLHGGSCRLIVFARLVAISWPQLHAGARERQLPDDTEPEQGSGRHDDSEGCCGGVA